MRLTISSLAAGALLLPLPTASAHAIFQKLSINGADKGAFVGIRVPTSNNPIQDVNSASLACNVASSYRQPVSSTVIDVPRSAKIGAWWGHIIGGPQGGANDPENPIAASHKGPIQVYIAKVDSAATASPSSSLEWIKVASDGLDTSTGKWAVDKMIADGGWNYFSIPDCAPAGQYLMRVELLALHSAGSQGGAQFYTSCAQINISGAATGSLNGPVPTAHFPGTYKATDPGILISIYSSSGKPDNGGKKYTAPGPAVATCYAGSSGGGNNGGSGGGSESGKSPLWGQCGGKGWTGPTECEQGKCVDTDLGYYSQCQPN